MRRCKINRNVTNACLDDALDAMFNTINHPQNSCHNGYRCPICNRDFKNNSSLRSHRSRFHGSSKVEENINQTYKDTPVPDNSDLDSANEPTDISDIESDTYKERDDGSEEASDNEEDESDINVDDTENNTETSEYENSDGRVSPIKRKVYRKRKRDALSTPIDSSEDEYPKKTSQKKS